MRAVTNTLLSNNNPEVRLTHKEESLSFSISVFGRNSFKSESDVFEQINKFWASLPESQQTQIFQIYKDIQYGFDNVYQKNELAAYLSDKVKLLLDIHNLDTLYDWVTFKSDIKIPVSFDSEYVHSIDNHTSREKTYTKSDYIKLVTLALCLRCMVPVWGEHISVIRKESGTRFKEFYAFQLLNKSNLINSLPMEKLKTYIDHNVGQDKFDPNNTLNAISSEDFGFWLLSLVCVRRLCVGDISGADDSTNMITSIYKFIMQRIQNNDNNHENIVKENKFDEKSNNAENKISTLERYKTKTNISPGEIVELEYCMRDIYDVVNKLSYTVDRESLDKSLATSQLLLNERILDPQMALLRWVFKPVISPRGLMYLPKPVIVKALGALEAVLWARGHKYLALLATSHAIISDREMLVSPVDSKMRVPKEMSDELDKLYPFTRMVSGKKSAPKVVNLSARSIDIVTNNLMTFSWKPTASEAMIKEVFGTNIRRLPIRPDIKTDLTRLVIEIGNRSWS